MPHNNTQTTPRTQTRKHTTTSNSKTPTKAGNTIASEPAKKGTGKTPTKPRTPPAGTILKSRANNAIWADSTIVYVTNTLAHVDSIQRIRGNGGAAANAAARPGMAFEMYAQPHVGVLTEVLVHATVIIYAKNGVKFRAAVLRRRAKETPPPPWGKLEMLNMTAFPSLKNINVRNTKHTTPSTHPTAHL
jgi:hypothetical protein